MIVFLQTVVLGTHSITTDGRGGPYANITQCRSDATEASRHWSSKRVDPWPEAGQVTTKKPDQTDLDSLKKENGEVNAPFTYLM